MHVRNLKILLICAASFILAGAAAWGVFEAMPHLEDEHANLFQARVFASGRVTNPAPPHAEAFFVPFVVEQGGRQFSKYTPGFSLALSLGVLAGHPWLVNALAASLGLLATYLLGRELYDEQTGLWAALLGLVSPLYVILSGSLLPHTTTLAALTLFAWAFLRSRRVSTGWTSPWPWLAGALAGWGLVTRPWTAVGLCLPFAVMAAVDVLYYRRRGAIYLQMGAAFVLVGSMLPLYNALAAGSPFTNTYTLIWPYDRVGFGPDIGRTGHSLDEGLSSLTVSVPLFAREALSWPVLSGTPLMFLVLLLGLVLPIRSSRELVLLAPPAALVLAYTAYWTSGGGVFGARYYAEALPYVWLLCARGLVKCSILFSPRLVRLALAALLAWGLFYPVPARLQTGRGLYGISRQDASQIHAAGVTQAIVFVKSDKWTEYGNLSWLNSPDLQDAEVIFAKNLGRRTNERIAAAFPGRRIYYYNRDAPNQLVASGLLSPSYE